MKMETTTITAAAAAVTCQILGEEPIGLGIIKSR
jgi:hypothetical protein